MIRIYLLTCLILGSLSLDAQKFLQMEKAGSFKVKRYYRGDEVTFKIVDDEEWYTEEILDLLVDDGLVLFSYRAVPVENITHIRSFKMQNWSKPFGRQFYNFGLGWIVFSLGDALFGNPITSAIIYVPLTAGALGLIIQKAFRQRTFKMGKNRRLRLLNLNFKPGLGP